MYNYIVPEFTRMLNSCNTLLDKAVQHAEAKKYDPNILLNCRLAPDQYSFLKQIQVVCDNAKGTVARLAGKEVPKHEDNEMTVKDLRNRIEKTITFLKTFKASDFAGAEERKIDIFFLPGKYLNGFEYATELAVPNFYFHLTTAYAILRHNGVEVGKMDYLGPVNFHSK